MQIVSICIEFHSIIYKEKYIKTLSADIQI